MASPNKINCLKWALAVAYDNVNILYFFVYLCKTTTYTHRDIKVSLKNSNVFECLMHVPCKISNRMWHQFQEKSRNIIKNNVINFNISILNCW